LGAVGTRRRVRIAASDVSLARQPASGGSTILNVMPARVVASQPQDDVQVMAVIALGEDGRGARMLARVTRKSWDLLALAPDQPVFAQIKGVALVSRETNSG
ncbi:MAG TPA: TOBE domain-containing protein, partial [Azospirillum sp.]